MTNNKCIVCEKNTKPYLKKNFNDDYLKTCEYEICENCGFVYNKTMYNMSFQEWININNLYHKKEWQAKKDKNYLHNPPYLQQALFLNILKNEKLISDKNWLDYASGLGMLSKILKTYFGLNLETYEKYTCQDNKHLSADLPNKKYGVVFSSALLEHIRNIDPIKEMLSLLDENGCFMVHTLIRENIPKDPSWFYFLPVHCSFFTNKAMSILMDKYNFKYSLYSPLAKTWVLYKKKPINIDEKIENINNSLGSKYIYGKDGFMNYWQD